MAKKKLLSGLELDGIAPNLLLKDIYNTAPFIFEGELDTAGEKRQFLEKLKFYRKNLKTLSQLNLAEYFYLCLAAHWSTAGTFVPTDVDNQIRENLWKHKNIKKYIEKMAQITIESWEWDFEQVTNRKCYRPSGEFGMSTHEGTWLSVAIGAYCALKKNNKDSLCEEMQAVILKEIRKEEELLIELREKRDSINFLRAAPLLAHNLGDLDRVMVQWNMHETDSFCKSIYKLGHIVSESYSPILVYTGKVNKEFSSKENHRHMPMRGPKCLRKSHKFLIPVGPFMDDWGSTLGASDLLTLEEKAEIIVALFLGYKRQEQAFGYSRAYGAMMKSLAESGENIENYLAFDFVYELKKSSFLEVANESQEEFENKYTLALNEFVCDSTHIKF